MSGRTIDGPITIEQLRELDGSCIHLRVAALYQPRRRPFGRQFIRGLTPKEGHDVIGWICGFNRGGGKVLPRPYVITRPSWTGHDAPETFVYLEDIYQLKVVYTRPEAVLPGDCPNLDDLQAYLEGSELLAQAVREEIRQHLQWCRACDSSCAVVNRYIETLRRRS
jgi:hypothetical protein